MLNQIIPLLLIIVIGASLRGLGFLDLSAGRVISRLVIYVTIPIVIFRAVSQMDIRRGLLWLVLLGVGVPMTTLLIGRWTTRATTGATRGTILIALCGKNTDLFALPVIQSIYGLSGVSLLALVSMGNALCVFGIGFLMAVYFDPNRGEIDLKKLARSIAFFPPIVAFVLALAANLLGFALPKLFLSFAEVVGDANVFLSLLVIGLFLDIRVVMRSIRVLVIILLTKYSVALVIGGLFYALFFRSEPLMATVGLLASLMPAPVVTLVYSAEKNLDHETAGAVVGITTIISSAILLVLSVFI